MIPACVVLAIRKQFPEAEGNYPTFKEATITELDLAFFEYFFFILFGRAANVAPTQVLNMYADP